LSTASVSITLVLAIYGAVVSSVVGAWQIINGLLHRRTRVRVRVYLGSIMQPGLSESPDLVIVNAVNESDHAVRWTNGSLCVQGSESGRVMPANFPYGDPLPQEIPSRDARDMTFVASNLGDFDFSKPVVAVVSLSTGKEFYSKPTVLEGSS